METQLSLMQYYSFVLLHLTITWLPSLLAPLPTTNNPLMIMLIILNLLSNNIVTIAANISTT